jgi:NO-binding membrane sensor protein with MHYT domain
MAAVYNPWLVLLSIAVAVFVSHTALNLSSRVARSRHKPSARLWLVGGAVSMGCGIGSMHFVGMLALSLPIALSYDIATPSLRSQLRSGSPGLRYRLPVGRRSA